MRFLKILLTILTIQGVYANTNTHNQKHFNNWIAHIEQKSNKKICYAFTEHFKRSLLDHPKPKALFVVNYSPQQHFTLSYIPGFIIDTNFLVELKFLNKKIALDNKYQSFAATYSAHQDISIIDLFIKGAEKNFVIKSFREKNQAALDYFSLTGFKQAITYLRSNCY